MSKINYKNSHYYCIYTLLTKLFYSLTNFMYYYLGEPIGLVLREDNRLMYRRKFKCFIYIFCFVVLIYINMVSLISSVLSPLDVLYILFT